MVNGSARIFRKIPAAKREQAGLCLPCARISSVTRSIVMGSATAVSSAIRLYGANVTENFFRVCVYGPQFPRASRNGKRMRQEECSDRRAENVFVSRGEKVLFCCARVLLWWLISANRYVLHCPGMKNGSLSRSGPFKAPVLRDSDRQWAYLPVWTSDDGVCNIPKGQSCSADGSLLQVQPYPLAIPLEAGCLELNPLSLFLFSISGN